MAKKLESITLYSYKVAGDNFGGIEKKQGDQLMKIARAGGMANHQILGDWLVIVQKAYMESYKATFPEETEAPMVSVN